MKNCVENTFPLFIAVFICLIKVLNCNKIILCKKNKSKIFILNFPQGHQEEAHTAVKI